MSSLCFRAERFGVLLLAAALLLSATLPAAAAKFRPIEAFCALKLCAGDSRWIDGKDPSSGLAYAGQSSGIPYDGYAPLFGTAEAGGSHGGGVAFQLSTRGSKWQQTVLYDFCAEADCADGTRPWQELAVDANSNLFGVTFGLGE